MYPALRIPMQNTHLSAPYESSSLATPYSGGTMGAGQWRQCEFMAAAERKPYNRASPGGKPANRPVGRLKCTPSAAYRRRLSTGKRLTRFSGRFCSPTNHVRLPPRRGRFALHSASGLISISRHSAAKTSPSGGSTAAGGDRGAFPTGAARLYGFPAAVRRHIKFIAAGDTTTLSRQRRLSPPEHSEHNPLPEGQSPFARGAGVNLLHFPTVPPAHYFPIYPSLP